MRWNRFFTVAVVVYLMTAGHSPAAATPAETGLMLRTDGCSRPVDAPVLGTTVELRVTGIVARARVTQIFKNPTQSLMEGIYVFPLPEGTAVDSLHMKVGDRVIEGVVQEKREARQTYEAAKQGGTKATLIEQQMDGVFRTSIANIGPGDTIEVEIEMQQVVRYAQGHFSLRFPMVVAPRFTPERAASVASLLPPVLPAGAAPINPFAFHVDLAPGFPLARVESSTHRIAVAKGKGKDGSERWAVDLADGMAFADGDVDLEWAPAVGREPRAVYFSEEVDGERYSLLMVMPPNDAEAVAARLPRETIFVIDTSGSMDGTSIEQARQALLVGINRLQPGDWFNVIQFNSATDALFPASVPAGAGYLARARQYVGALRATGGTVMLPALNIALGSAPAQPGLVPQVIFTTDGQVGNDGELLAAIRKNLGERRLFTVAIGSSPNAAFLRKAAEIGRGTFTAIDSVDQVAERMGFLLAQLEAPMLRQVDVRWGDPAAEAWPQQTPDLYLGEPLIVTARTSAAGPVAVSGLRDGRDWSDELPAPAQVRGAGLDKLWAGRKIESLMDSLAEGADRQEVRRQVVELGLRHHLLTQFTSLVAVDVEPTAPPRAELVTRVVPVNPPRGSGAPAAAYYAPDPADADGVQDVITVLSESPLLDERRITTGSTVSQAELAKIPTARDPWTVLQATPGVLTDRINAGGNEGGQQSSYVVAGSPEGQNVWEIDGVVITDASALAAPGGYFDFDSFEEMWVDTGGGDVKQPSAGAHVQLTSPRGTNEWRGSGDARWSGPAIQWDGTGDPETNRLDSLRSAGLEAGGPLVKDRFWLWGSLGRSEADRIAFGGQATGTSQTRGKLKLNAQLADDNSASLVAGRSGTFGSGFGAGPERARETTLQGDGREDVWRLEDTHIFAYNFYLTAAASQVDGRWQGDPLRPAAEARVDEAGVAHGGWFGQREDRRSRTFSLTGTTFFNSGPVSHEVSLGLEENRQDRGGQLTVPRRLTVAGTVVGLPSGFDVLEEWRAGDVDTRTRVTGVRAQDGISVGDWFASFGLRIDEQDLGIAGGPRPRSFAPRLAVTRSLGSERATMLRASFSRFASRLGDRASSRIDPEAPGALFSYLSGGLPVAWYADGVDPLHPGLSPNRIDADLRPEITDEAILSGEHAFQPEFVVGLQATWRRTRGILEDRLLVRDAAGDVRLATRSDWEPGGTLSGVLPDGSRYEVPYFDLRPGLSPTGGRLLVNGDRHQDSLGLSLTWQKRLSHGWMSRGHFTWQDWTWTLGPAFRRFDDPTNTLGSGDDDGSRVSGASNPVDLPHDPNRFLGGRWSFSASGFVNLPWNLGAAISINGREGALLPYFRQVARDRAGIVDVQLTGRVDSFRTRDLVSVDARLEREISFESSDFELTLSLEAFNLLDDRSAVARELDLGVTRAGRADELVPPRTLRLGLRLGWR